jgi:gluconokinase
MKTDFIVVMGISGSGKTSIGRKLAIELSWQFFDADNFHPPENVEKMARGIPLDDLDRLGWLTSLNNLIMDCQKINIKGVLACSALKEVYRQTLTTGCKRVRFVYLKGDYDLILSRMSRRQGHYMKPEMLQSQFATLEEPENTLVVDISKNIKDIVAEITAWLDSE